VDLPEVLLHKRELGDAPRPLAHDAAAFGMQPEVVPASLRHRKYWSKHPSEEGQSPNETCVCLCGSVRACICAFEKRMKHKMGETAKVRDMKGQQHM